MHDGVYYSSYICHGCAANQVEAAIVLCGACCSRASTDEVFRAKTDKAREDKKLWFHLPSSGMVLCEPHIPVPPQSLPYFPKDDWFHRPDDPDDYCEDADDLCEDEDDCCKRIEAAPVAFDQDPEIRSASRQLGISLEKFDIAVIRVSLEWRSASKPLPGKASLLAKIIERAFMRPEMTKTLGGLLIGTEPEAVAEILHKTLTEAQKKTLAAELIKGTADLVSPAEAGLHLRTPFSCCPSSLLALTPLVSCCRADQGHCGSRRSS